MTLASARRLAGRALALLAAVSLVAVVAGCGLSEDDEPHAIPATDIPGDLLDRNPTTTTVANGVTVPVTVYLLTRDGASNRLVGVTREVEDPRSPGDRIDALLVPTSREEQAEGFSSAIPSDTVLLDTTLLQDNQELVVNLSGALFDIQGQELAHAFAQLVYTVTELEGVRRVRFEVENEPYRAPNAEGVEQEGAVTRADYASLAPRK